MLVYLFFLLCNFAESWTLQAWCSPLPVLLSKKKQTRIWLDCQVSVDIVIKGLVYFQLVAAEYARSIHERAGALNRTYNLYGAPTWPVDFRYWFRYSKLWRAPQYSSNRDAVLAAAPRCWITPVNAASATLRCCCFSSFVREVEKRT